MTARTAHNTDSQRTAELLVQGADSRSIPDPDTGLNKYGCSPYPRDCLPFGSCTSSSPSRYAFNAARTALRRYNEGEIRDVRSGFQEIRNSLNRMLYLQDGPVAGTEIVFCPSGTDAELLVMMLMHLRFPDQDLVNIMVAPREIGGGSVIAAGGLYFDEHVPGEDELATKKNPVVAQWARETTVQSVFVRDANGLPRDPADINDECARLAEEAIRENKVVLQHIVKHTKTGVHAPGLSRVRTLQQAHGQKVQVLVDAAQGRFSRRGMRALLAEGDIVLVTGSKFFGGPPFSCALLLPPQWVQALQNVRIPQDVSVFFHASEWPVSLQQCVHAIDDGDENLGLMLRWYSAIAEMQRYYATPARQRLNIMRYFETRMPEIMSTREGIEVLPVDSPILQDDVERVLESKTTVIPFRLRGQTGYLDYEQLWQVFHTLNTRDSEAGQTAIHLGQPVELAKGYSVLRIALGAPMIAELADKGSEWQAQMDRCLQDTANQIHALASTMEGAD